MTQKLRTRQAQEGETPTWPATDILCKRCFLVASGLDAGDLEDDCGADVSPPDDEGGE